MFKILKCKELSKIYLGLNKILYNIDFSFIYKNTSKIFLYKLIKKQTIIINNNNLNILKYKNYFLKKIKFILNFK